MRLNLAKVLLAIAITFVTHAQAQPYAGWDRLTERLKADGVPSDLLQQVYNGNVVPEYGFIPFRLRPRETKEMYRGFDSPEIRAMVRSCRKSHSPAFETAEKTFGVSASVLASILVVETRCGKLTGKELVVNRLSRVSNVGESINIARNLLKVREEEDRHATKRDLRERAQYLENSFYPQLLALFREHIKGNVDLFSLRGSIAGAFGWPQFLPKTYSHFGIDGDKDGRISLFGPADAIHSAAHYLAAHGWKEGMGDQEKRKVIWHYNKSDPYIDTVLALSRTLEK